MNKYKLIINSVWLFIVCLAISFLIYSYLESGKKRLDNSLSVAIANTLGITYTIKESIYDELGPDLIGTWWISSNCYLNSEHLMKKSLKKSLQTDENDVTFLRNYFEKKFQYKESLDDFNEYSLDMKLGINSVCENSNCNIQLLLSKGKKDIFVRIIKF